MWITKLPSTNLPSKDDKYVGERYLSLLDYVEVEVTLQRQILNIDNTENTVIEDILCR
jgi:hypothetical protein